MKIFIGNLSTSADEKGMKNLFTPYGKVNAASIVYDNYTRRSRGCGYVEMDDHLAGASAIARLINMPFMRQSLVVREAESKGFIPGNHY